MHEKIGTVYYVAPEVLDRQYDKRCDLWSVGVVTYVLLAGDLPFSGSTSAAVSKKIREADYTFHGEVWDNQVSKHAIEFINRLIEPNLNQRMTVEEALEHPWLTKVTQHGEV